MEQQTLRFRHIRFDEILTSARASVETLPAVRDLVVEAAAVQPCKRAGGE